MSVSSSDLILCVAPNGAYKVKKDHPAVPLTPDEIAQSAEAALKAGANMIHLHVREQDGSHSLDPVLYQEALAATRQKVGDQLLIQITTEAAGKFNPDVQMKAALEVKPEAVSLGLREFLKPGQDTSAFKEFWHRLQSQGTWAQVILYDEGDLNHLINLKEDGVISSKNKISVLFVLGRYKKGHSTPHDLIPFVQDEDRLSQLDWSVCAFGPKEHQCLSTALAMGGHVRVGFENNLHLLNGEIAPDNAALVGQIAHAAKAIGREMMSVDNLRLNSSNS